MKTKQQQEAIDAMTVASDLCKAAGVHVAFVTCVYSASTESADDAHFSSRLSVRGDRASGVSEDHIMLDMQRELLVLWSNSTHTSQLEWTESKS